MTSLVEEYRKRHRIDCVWPVNEGVLFFNRMVHSPKCTETDKDHVEDCKNKINEPALIAITSSFTKQLFYCPGCVKNT